MLIKLLPDQISKHWDYVSYAVEKGLDGVTEAELNNVLQAIYENKMLVWLSMNRTTIQGIVLTTLDADLVLQRKTLVMYLFYRFSWMEKDEWFDGLETLKKYAASIGCDRIVAYTEKEEVVKLAKSLGGQLKRFILEFPVQMDEK